MLPTLSDSHRTRKLAASASRRGPIYIINQAAEDRQSPPPFLLGKNLEATTFAVGATIQNSVRGFPSRLHVKSDASRGITMGRVYDAPNNYDVTGGIGGKRKFIERVISVRGAFDCWIEMVSEPKKITITVVAHEPTLVIKRKTLGKVFRELEWAREADPYLGEIVLLRCTFHELLAAVTEKYPNGNGRFLLFE